MQCMPAEYTDDIASANRYTQYIGYIKARAIVRWAYAFYQVYYILSGRMQLYNFVIISFLGLLVHRSYGGYLWDEKLDFSTIPNVWQVAGRAFDPPSVEHDVSPCSYKEDFLNITKNYGDRIMATVYNQTIEKSNELIYSIQKAAENLKKSLESDKKNVTKPKVESAVIVFTDLLEEYMELEPGYTIIKLPKLPSIPEQTTVIPPKPGKRSAKELYVGFPSTMYYDFLSTYGSLKTLYLEGWRAATSYFEIILAQFREQLLNRKITYAYKKIVNIIIKYSDLIRRYVSKETWNRFNQGINNVIRVPDSPCSTASAKCCYSGN